MLEAVFNLVVSLVSSWIDKRTYTRPRRKEEEGW